MRPTGSATELEARRRRAAECFQAGEPLRTVADRFAACGYPQAATWGENIAEGYATAQAVVDGWLASPPATHA